MFVKFTFTNMLYVFVGVGGGGSSITQPAPTIKKGKQFLTRLNQI